VSATSPNNRRKQPAAGPPVARAPGALEAFRALWVLIFGPQISVRAKAH
jgi:hypothetical protein